MVDIITYILKNLLIEEPVVQCLDKQNSVKFFKILWTPRKA